MSVKKNLLLYEKINELSHSDYYPFHMPGHKRNGEDYPLSPLYKIDITEIDEFDNLHEPEGIIKDSMEYISNLYKSDKSYFLINGSSGGILSAISSSVTRGGKILLARNSHKSAYHAVFLNDLQVQYLYPEYIEEYDLLGGIKPEQVEKFLQEEKDIEAVFITSPTYDGMISDINGIVEICHKYDVICIVDEAHGAHLGLFGMNEKSSAELGADIVIHSIHKTLPAPTQTALLHINGRLIKRETLEYYLRIYQTSSPSYILMAGIDQCFQILKHQGNTLFLEFHKNRELFFEKVGILRYIRVLSSNSYCKSEHSVCSMDMMKIIISVKDFSIDGKQLYETLRSRYHLQMEMFSENYVLAIITIMDKKEGFDRLAAALIELDKEMVTTQTKRPFPYYTFCRNTPLVASSIYQAQREEKIKVDLNDAMGRISGEFVHLYPPGIPIIVPGEEFTEEIIAVIEYYYRQNYKIQGIDKDLGKLIVVKDERYVKM